MRTLKLKGKSLKGKNRIAEHGELWKVVSEGIAVGLTSMPPHLLIKSVKDGDTRWISESHDNDFQIIEDQ